MCPQRPGQGIRAPGTKGARRWGSEPTLRPRPSHQAGCLARLDRGEGAQRERTRGPASKQQAAKGPRGPLLQDPEQLQLRLCPRGPPSRPSQTKASGRRSRLCKVQKRQILSARNPNAHCCPQVRARSSRARAAGEAAGRARPGRLGRGRALRLGSGPGVGAGCGLLVAGSQTTPGKEAARSGTSPGPGP